MMSWELLSQPAFQRLATALIHFLWQGALIAALVALLMRCLSSHASHLRYGLLSVGMMLMAAAPLFTFCLTQTNSISQHLPRPNATTQTVSAISQNLPKDLTGNHPEDRPVPGHPENGLIPTAERAVAKTSALPTGSLLSSQWLTVDDALTTARPWLLTAWLCGVLLFSVRLVLGYAAVRWLMRSRQPVSRRLAQITRTMSRRIGLHRVPIVAGCERVADAMVVGFVRPMVLLPAAWCTQLSPDILEAVIAHELAHIRRCDLWVNLLQRLMETVLFYHPAVWWISRRLRAERELCCDTVAVAATGERLRYVEALAAVASAGSHQPSHLLTAQMGGRQMALLNRVRHILGRTSRERYLGNWSAGAMVLAVPLGLWLAAATMLPAAAEEADGPPKRPSETRRSDRGPDGFRTGPPKFRHRDGRDHDGRRDGRRDDRNRPPRDGFRGERPRRERSRGERPEGRRPQGDRPHHRPSGPPDGPDGFRDRGPRGARSGDHPGPEQLIHLIQQLREEVQQLRHEVNELRGQRRPDFGRRGQEGDRRFGPSEGARPPRGGGDGFRGPRRGTERDGDRGPHRSGNHRPHRRPPEGRGPRGAHRPGDDPSRQGPPRQGPPPRRGGVPNEDRTPNA